MIYLDFNRVHHGVLIRNLRKLGIAALLLKCFHEFLSKRKQSVVKGKSSNESDVLSGVAQGTIHEPPLLILFVGDIDARIQHGNALPFADYTRVMMKIKQQEYTNKLQEDSNAVCQRAENNNMMLNAWKFQHVRNGLNPPNPVSYKATKGSEIETETAV